MKRLSSIITISAFVLIGGAIVGSAPASAATPSTLVISGGSAVFGLDPVSIVATANNAGTVKFIAAGAVLKGCEAIATATTAPFVAKCLWTPTASGTTVLAGTFTPTDTAAYTSVDSAPFTTKVGVAVQGVISPIHIFVDTVLASGSTGALAPRFGVGCTVSSEYIIGQTIVFRIYANNSDQGGAVMDSSNTAKAYIEVAGVATPITLNYGNHSGVAFWTGVLKTGTTAGSYSTLGLINFKVTMIGKDQSSMKVLSTKLAPKMVNGLRQTDSNGRTIYERVSYYRTVQVDPVLKGATGTWASNFTAASQLTLYALPKA
jgi:hypothetical protein